MTATSLFTSLTITILPFGWIIPWTYTKCEYRGIYVDEFQTIYICDIGTADEKEYTKLHEIGHYVWFRKLTDSQRADYTKLYDRAMKQGRKAFPTDYAMTNVLESFAEDYVAYQINAKYPRHMKARINFIRSIWK